MEITMSATSFTRQARYLALDSMYTFLLLTKPEAVLPFSNEAIELPIGDLEAYYNLLELRLSQLGYGNRIEDIEKRIIVAVAEGLHGRKSN